jgi:hypothetical protein
MWCWWRMEKISQTDPVKNEVLHRAKEERIILNKKRNANWISHISRRKCFLKDVNEGKKKGRIEVKGRWGRRRKQVLDDLQETSGYWKLKEKALIALCAELALEEVINKNEASRAWWSVDDVTSSTHHTLTTWLQQFQCVSDSGCARINSICSKCNYEKTTNNTINMYTENPCFKEATKL